MATPRIHGAGGGRRRTRLGVPVLVLAVLALAFPLAAAGDTAQTLVPIGGGYDDATLEGFARAVGEHAGGDALRIVVNPATYGDAPEDREENLELAAERTQQIEDACAAVAADYEFDGCEAELLILLDRADALDPVNSLPIEDPETDGMYILGGDQTIAMQVLAGTPAEAAMAAAYARGVVYGGNSAGAAVESTTMIAGYTEPGWPYNALEQDKVIVWWSDNPDPERGLNFVSDNTIMDQHFYERGRFGRLLNIVAQSDEHFGGDSRLGLGVDYATGVRVGDDRLIYDVFGDTSVTLIDMEAMTTEPEWLGPNGTLSVRNVLTHVLAPDELLSYDIERRVPVYDGADVAMDQLPGWSGLLEAPGEGTLILGGDLSMDWEGPALDYFIDEVDDFGPRKIVVISAGYASGREARHSTSDYIRGLRRAGLDWPRYDVDPIVFEYGRDWSESSIADLEDADGVILLGGDQSQMERAVNDDHFRELVNWSVENAPVVLTDGAMTAVMGDWYVTNPNPTDDDYQDASIASYLLGEVTLAEGLGILPGASFQPANTYWQHWGRLYQLAIADPQTIVFGISELTAIAIHGDDSHVVGERSVIAVDGRAASTYDGNNGAFTALNVWLDLFAPGDTIETAR